MARTQLHSRAAVVFTDEQHVRQPSYEAALELTQC